MINFNGYNDFFRLFDFLISWWGVKMIKFTEYLNWIFWLFDLLLGGQNIWFYWIYWFFSTFLLFDLLVGGQNDQIYWIYYFFQTFRLFNLQSCWEVKMIDFTEFIWFFDFSASNWKVSWTILLHILIFSDISTFRPLAGKSKWFILLSIFNFSTFRLFYLLVGGQNEWFYRIYYIFSIFRTLDGRSKWSILLNKLDFFNITNSCWEIKLIDFTTNIDFFSTFGLFDLLLGVQIDWFYWITILIFFDFDL